MRYQGVIFDLDGVICSTDEYHYQAWKALADRLNIPFDREINNRLRGVSRMESLEIILEKSSVAYNDAQKAALAEEKNDTYRQLLVNITPDDLLPGVAQTLPALREAGLKLAIGSSSRNTPLILNRLGLGNFFDAVADGNTISHSKPYPEVFLQAAERIALSPDACLVVEDAPAGVEAGCAGQFDCAAIGFARDDVRARWHLTNFAELLDICVAGN